MHYLEIFFGMIGKKLPKWVLISCFLTTFCSCSKDHHSHEPLADKVIQEFQNVNPDELSKWNSLSDIDVIQDDYVEIRDERTSVLVGSTTEGKRARKDGNNYVLTSCI